MPQVYDDVKDVPAGLLAQCRAQPLPSRLLMCPPEYFDVIDVKNPHMAGNIGRIDRAAARDQWDALRATFAQCGAAVELIEPVAGCEDMVFCANQTFVGLDAAELRVCLLSRMTHASRQREVPAFARWFEAAGYQVSEAPGYLRFEGSGDAIWHPGRGLVWGGHGYRSEPGIYETVSDVFGVPVLRLRLLSDTFYHLDTCFCAIDERTVLIDPTALAPESLALVRHVFAEVIECPPDEARRGMACNATALGGRHVVIQQGNPRTVAALRQRGLEVHEVETGQFLKSGGSVFCLKMYVF